MSKETNQPTNLTEPKVLEDACKNGWVNVVVWMQYPDLWGLYASCKYCIWHHTCILQLHRSNGTQESLVERCGWPLPFYGDPPMSSWLSWCPCNSSSSGTACNHSLNGAWSGQCWMNVAASLSSERMNVQTTMVVNNQRPLLPVTLCQAPIRQPCILHWNNGTVGGYSKSQAFTYSKENGIWVG